MARTDLTPQLVPGKYPGVIGANEADFTWADGDAVNGNAYPCTGTELVLAKNAGAGAATITIKSSADPYGRMGDIAAYSIDPNEYAVFGPFPTLGWVQSDGKVYIDVSSADIKLAIIRM